jgi:hypothetical protein
MINIDFQIPPDWSEPKSKGHLIWWFLLNEKQAYRQIKILSKSILN